MVSVPRSGRREKVQPSEVIPARGREEDENEEFAHHVATRSKPRGCVAMSALNLKTQARAPCASTAEGNPCQG